MLCGVVGCVVLIKERGWAGWGVGCWVWFVVHCVVLVGSVFFYFFISSSAFYYL